MSFLRLVPHGRAEDNKEKIMLSDEELRSIQKELYCIKETGKKVRIGLPLSRADVKTKCHAVREKLYIWMRSIQIYKVFHRGYERNYTRQCFR